MRERSRSAGNRAASRAAHAALAAGLFRPAARPAAGYHGIGKLAELHRRVVRLGKLRGGGFHRRRYLAQEVKEQ